MEFLGKIKFDEQRATASVRMPMVQIRVMRVRMAQRGVTVPVRMRLGHRAIVEMLMMIVMRMAMLMAYRLVPVFVLVALREMQP